MAKSKVESIVEKIVPTVKEAVSGKEDLDLKQKGVCVWVGPLSVLSAIVL